MHAAGARHADVGQRVDDELLDRPHVCDRVGHATAALSRDGENGIADELARTVVGDITTTIGLDEISAHARRVDQHVRQIRVNAQREHVRVFEQQQVVVCRREQATLQRERVAVPHLAEPEHAQRLGAGGHASSASQSWVSSISRNRFRNAAAYAPSNAR